MAASWLATVRDDVRRAVAIARLVRPSKTPATTWRSAWVKCTSRPGVSTGNTTQHDSVVPSTRKPESALPKRRQAITFKNSVRPKKPSLLIAICSASLTVE